MTVPNLFSQFVPSISSTSCDDSRRSTADGADCRVANLGSGMGGPGCSATGIAGSVIEERGVAGWVLSPVIPCSATRTDGLGSTIGDTVGGETVSGETMSGV